MIGILLRSKLIELLLVEQLGELGGEGRRLRLLGESGGGSENEKVCYPS